MRPHPSDSAHARRAQPIRTPRHALRVGRSPSSTSDISDATDTPEDPAPTGGIFELESDTPGVSDSDADDAEPRSGASALARHMRDTARRSRAARHTNSPSFSSPLAHAPHIQPAFERHLRRTHMLRPASHSGSLLASVPRMARVRRGTPPGSMGPPAVPLRGSSPTRDRAAQPPLHRRALSTGIVDPLSSSPVGGPDGVDPGLVAAIGADVSMSPRPRELDTGNRLWSMLDADSSSPVHRPFRSGSWSTRASSPLAHATTRHGSFDTHPRLLSPLAMPLDQPDTIRLQPVPSSIASAGELHVSSRPPSRSTRPTSPLPSPVDSPKPLARRTQRRRHSTGGTRARAAPTSHAGACARVLAKRRTGRARWPDWSEDGRAPPPRRSWTAVRRAAPGAVPRAVDDECRRRSTPELVLRMHGAEPLPRADDVFGRAPRIVSAPIPPHMRPAPPRRGQTTSEGLTQREQFWQEVAHAKALCDAELERIEVRLLAPEDAGDVTTVACGEDAADDDDAHMAPLQRMAAIAVRVHGLDATDLAADPHVCQGFIGELQDLGPVWEEHPEWPGRAWHIELLLCIAGLSRVLEWWNEEHRFWSANGAREPRAPLAPAAAAAPPPSPQNVLLELSLDCRVQYLGATWASVTGIDPAPLYGAPVSVLVSQRCEGIFARAVHQLTKHQSHTAEIMFEAVHADGSLLPMAGQGMLVHAHAASHTMWVVHQLETGAGFVPDNVQLSAHGPADAPLSTELLLCRICERDIPAWFFAKHSEICNEIHRLEMETGTCNETLVDMCRTIDVIARGLEADVPQTYRGITLHAPSARPSALEAASRALSAEHASLGGSRKQCFRTLDKILDALQAALSVPMPAIPENADTTPARLELLPPGTDAQIEALRRWLPPRTREPALELMGNDAAAAVRAKMHVVTRMRHTIVYVETVRLECEQRAADILGPDVVVNEFDDLADGVGDMLLEPDAVSDSGGDGDGGAPHGGGAAPIEIPGAGPHTPPRSPHVQLPGSASSTGSRLAVPQSPYLGTTPHSPRMIPTAQPRATVTSIKDFAVIKPISKGAYGSVFLARKRATGDYYAIKVLKKSDMIAKNQITNVRAERTILMNRAQSPFVVRLFFTFQSAEYLYLVMEYLPGGDCASLVRVFGGLPEEWAQQYLAEIVQCLGYLHSTGVVHRDMKPDNWLIDNRGHLKLTDFGLSKFGLLGRQTHAPYAPPPMPNATWAQSGAGGAVPLAHADSPMFDTRVAPSEAFTSSMALGSETRLKRAVGTPDYLAPESVLGVGMDSFAIDWWAVGVMLFEFIFGYPPFHADTPAKVFDNIVSRNMDWDPRLPCSPAARDLINRLVCTEPSQRLGSHGVGEIKAHPFFAGIDWDHLTAGDGPFVPRVFDAESTDYFDPRGAQPCTFDDDAVSESSASSQICQSPPVRHSRFQRSLSSASLPANEFGSFSYKNLPVLKQANDEMVRRIRSEHMGYASPASDGASRSSPAMSGSVASDSPHAPADEPVISTPASLHSDLPPSPAPDDTPPCVLVADENAVSRSMLDAAFSACGVAVDMAADGAEAVRLALGHRKYTAVLLSLSLRIVYSHDAARMIKSTRNPNTATPIIALVLHEANDDIDVSGSVFDTFMALPPSIVRVRALLGWIREYTSAGALL